MGSSINLIDNYKPNRVIFNCGSYEELEETLIKKLDSLNIPYSSCMSELNINNYNTLHSFPNRHKSILLPISYLKV